MKMILITASLLLLAQPAVAEVIEPQTADSSANVTPDFKSQVEAWKEAYNSGDPLKLIPFYSIDAVYSSSHVPGLVAQGRDSLISNFGKGIRMGGKIEKIEILSAELSCGLAALFCLYEANNAGRKASGRNLLVLRNENGKWLIIRHMTVV